MKICAVICEYNPFHNGHQYQLDLIRRESDADAVLCLMSGNFTQRGDAALLEKFTRAKHAVENGADLVLELPTAFSVAPAEIFARGAVRLLSSVPSVETLAFGCECGSGEEFLRAAEAAEHESEEFRFLLKKRMKEGVSFVRARADALSACHPEVNCALFSSPNNILGTEYCRAILSCNSKIRPLPLLRNGAGFSEDALLENFSSASAIRKAIFRGEFGPRLKGNLPENVFRDVKEASAAPYGQAALCALHRADCKTISQTTDCSEGLENRLKKVAFETSDYSTLLEKTVSKRYTLSRIKRILAQNFLGVYRQDVKEYLTSPLYLKVLAVKESKKSALFKALGESEFPLLVKRSDARRLSPAACRCFETDVRATLLYNSLNNTQKNPYETLIV